MADPHLVTDLDHLTSLYGDVSHGASVKEQPKLHEFHRALIEASPFCVLTSVGSAGTDGTPRGDAPGFVRVVDDTTLEIPDRKGNNRLDTLRNILEDGRVSLLFLIPTRIDSLRVNGRAVISTDPEVLASHAIDGKPPATVIRVTIDAVYTHCGKAMIRSNLWDPDEWASIDGLPTVGQLSAAFKDYDVDVEAYDAGYEDELRANLL